MSIFEHYLAVRVALRSVVSVALGPTKLAAICRRWVSGVVPDLARRLAAEALGTAILVAAIVGSGIMADRLTNDVALSLLGNTIPTGAILVVLITILGPVSGAHFNPAVTMVFALRRDIEPIAALFYIAMQILGGYCRIVHGACHVRASNYRGFKDRSHR